MHGSPSPRGAAARRGRSPRHHARSPAPSALPPDFSVRGPATFTSCLTIPVEGATPIERPDSSSTPSTPAPSDSNKRAPRKSKMDALAALHSHTQTSLGEESQSDSQEDVGIRIQLRDGPPIPVSPTLNLFSVKTPSSRPTGVKPTPRPFGLTDCPTFHPTPEQWKDPMAYISSVSALGKRFGMCKIVPPAGWNMPFVTDTERFRFKTRLQRLNSIEASSRAKVNFLEQLYRFHKQQGNSRVSVPTINHKPLDLWLLRKEVHKLGGYEAVSRDKKWADLGRLLGYTGIPGLATQMRNSYSRVILPYEQFCERVRSSTTLSPIKPRDPALKTHASTQSLGTAARTGSPTPRAGPSSTAADDDSPPSSPLTATSSPLSEPPEESELREANGVKAEGDKPRRRSARHASMEQTAASTRGRRASTANEANGSANEKKNPRDELYCEICLKQDKGEKMLICDGCDCGFHMFCLDPPLEWIPRGEWFCHNCLFTTGGDFGFDEGEEHSLSSFQARDLEFRRLYFLSHPPPSVTLSGADPAAANGGAANDPYANRFGTMVITEDDVEHEFWRLVQSPTETVEVEYGADVHSTTHGSGMPSLETHPLDPYSKDPWNLNNIPILPQSLLRYIKSDISGMTVPWTYVGMIFSTFCWHNEDHYTYSINYMHWGETKTWYSIPGSDAEKFEAAIKKEAPDLFEAQPDLLFQLVTLMNPQRLKDAGVDVYGCNQRAGEFVVTFPKAYHAGFNHGLNFNEAVNFALPDWLPLGRDCVRRYQEHGKMPVFSHDELLITITQQSQSIRTALWLNDSLQEMTDREMDARTRARGLQMNEVLDETDRASDDQYQCVVCKVFLYLSQITCSCTTKVVCIDHVPELCKCPTANRTLRKRFSDTELQDIQAKVSERASVPAQWRTKLTKLLDDTPCPPLQALRALSLEGERIEHHLTELDNLRKCVNRANVWLEAANAIIARKPTYKRGHPGRQSVGTPEAGDLDEEVIEKPERKLSDLYKLLMEVEHLGFDAPEIAQLRAIAEQAEETRKVARDLLERRPPMHEVEMHVQNCRRLIKHAVTLNVLVDEIVEVEKIVLRQELLRELETDLNDEHLSLEDVRQLVARARACNLSLDHPYAQRLEHLYQAGMAWENNAKRVLEKQQRTLEDLEEFARSRRPGVPIDLDLLERLLELRKRGRDYERQAKSWLHADARTEKPNVVDVVKLVADADRDFNIVSVGDLKRTSDFAQDLEMRCEAVLKGTYQVQDEPDIFQTMVQWRKYAKDHLTMFRLPNFEQLDKQLYQHVRWLEKLPWYCRQHNDTHGQPILDDVVESTRPEDDLPPSDEYFTCICTSPVRPPAVGQVSDAVQCDHCFARFHGVCAANGGSCPFCDHHHWNGTIHKERSWHFVNLPPQHMSAPPITRYYSEEYKQLEIIVHRVDRLLNVVGQFISFISQPANQRPEYIPQVRHYMRKLYKIQFAVSPNAETSYGLDLASLHRILAGQPAPIRTKKRRRPKFTFGQDLDQDWQDGTRCICRGRTPYLLNFPTVECELCGKLYHGGCVFFPNTEPNAPRSRFTCPLCCVRKNRVYPFSEVRVKHPDNPDPNLFVDTKLMLESFSKDIKYMRLPPPYTQTLFVDLIRFTPGQPDNIAPTAPSASPPASAPPSRMMPPGSSPMPISNGGSAHPRSMHPPHPPHPHPHPHAHTHAHAHAHVHAQAPAPASHAHPHSHAHAHAPTHLHPQSQSAGLHYDRSIPPASHHVPPPPWAAPNSSSRWSTAAAAAAPPGRALPPPHTPSSQPQTPVDQLRSPMLISTPPLSTRKRKYPEEMSPEDRHAPAPPQSHRSPQRMPSQHSTPQLPAAAAPRPQGMSPSLAMMLSPTPADMRSPSRQPPPPPPPPVSKPYSRGPPPPPPGPSGMPLSPAEMTRPAHADEVPPSPHSGQSSQLKRVRLVYGGGQGPSNRGDEEHWGGMPPHDRSPQLPRH